MALQLPTSCWISGGPESEQKHVIVHQMHTLCTCKSRAAILPHPPNISLIAPPPQLNSAMESTANNTEVISPYHSPNIPIFCHLQTLLSIHIFRFVVLSVLVSPDSLSRHPFCALSKKESKQCEYACTPRSVSTSTGASGSLLKGRLISGGHFRLASLVLTLARSRLEL